MQGQCSRRNQGDPKQGYHAKAKKGDANQDLMLKQNNQPKRAQKCAPGKTPHFCIGPTDEVVTI